MSRRPSTPSYRHHKARGLAVVRLNGHDIYLGPYNSKASRDEYDRVISEWLAAGRQLPSDERTTSCADLALAYIDADAIPANHFYGIRALLRLFVRLYGSTPAADFGPLALQAVRNKLVQKGLKRKMVNIRVNQLRRLFKWGVSHEMVSEPTYGALMAVEGLRKGQTTAPESKKVKGVPLDHVEACINTMPPMLAAMVRIQLLTGMRAAELCQLRGCDLNTRGDVWTYTPESHKTEHHGEGHERHIPIGSQGREVLEPWLLPDLQAYVFSPARADAMRREARTAERKTRPGQGNVVGKNLKASRKRPPGERYITAAYRRAIEYAIDRTFPPPAHLAKAKGETVAKWKSRLGPLLWAELKRERKTVRWTPHRIRHTFGQLVWDRFGPQHAQRALGHSSLQVTQMYAEANKEKAVEVAKAMG